MMGLSFTSSTEGILLMALALGYIVCYLANREEGNFRSAGFIIGVFIIFLSIILIFNNLISGIRFYRNMEKVMLPQRHMMGTPPQR